MIEVGAVAGVVVVERLGDTPDVTDIAPEEIVFRVIGLALATGATVLWVYI